MLAALYGEGKCEQFDCALFISNYFRTRHDRNFSRYNNMCRKLCCLLKCFCRFERDLSLKLETHIEIQRCQISEVYTKTNQQLLTN